MDLKIIMFVILLIATFLMLFVAYLAFRKWNLDVARYCAFVMLAASFYSLGYGFEIVSTDLDQARFWLKVQYIGIPFITTFWLIWVIKYTGHHFLLKNWVIPLLFAIPILTLALHYTNEIHHFFYREVQFDLGSSNLSPTILIRGAWYWVHISYIYLEAAVGMGLFARMYSKAVPLVRKQVVVLMLGAAAPWLSNIIYLTEYNQVNLDLTPLGFALTGLIYIWGIYRFNLLRLVPVAYQTIFETMQDGVIILDYDNNITHVNQAARGIFKQLNPLPGDTASVPVHEVFASNPELLSRINVKEYSECRISIPYTEETRYYHVKITVIADMDQHSLGKLLIFNDITQVTLYQEKLLSNANQLAELHEFKDKLFTVVTHDIRDPLAILVNLTEIIEEDFVEGPSEEYQVFHEISEQVRDTYMLVEHLLDWFRSQKGKSVASPLVWNLEPIIGQSVEVMRIRSELKNIQITAVADEKSKVYADKEMVELILRNLLSNAIKFTDRNGQIHVEATKIGEQVKISVRDSGIGVDPEIWKSLFQEVQQDSLRGTAGERGSGIGLYLCGKFVQMNGGQIGFENNHDQGSTFTFTLPSNDESIAQPSSWQEEDAI